MLRIYEVALVMAGDAATLAERVEQKDGDLARQLRRAMQSVVLNLAEGSGNFGDNKRQRYQTALGSAREVLACVQVAQAIRIIGKMDDAVLDRMNQVIATLVQLIKRRG